MARISPVLVLPLVLAAGLGGLFLWGMGRDNPDQLPSALVGRAAPVMLDPLGQAAPFTDADLADGKVKIVNFWASWCSPCRAEHPNLMVLAAEGLPVYGVNYKDDPDDALAFLKELGNPFTRMGADRKGRMGIDWGLYGVPETFVIDGAGRVVLRFPGPLTQRALTSDVRPALEQAASGD
jgi:cytochrome c biogenesis protein CcmG/thiol:disulfide interchange protein DsbE